MAFHYRKSIDGDSVIPAKPYPLEATYATTVKVGDVVRLNGSGQVVKAATGDTNVLGVVQGLTFEGLGNAPKVAHVCISPNAVYEADYVGAGAIAVGAEYGIDGNDNLDTADTAVPIAKIVEVVKGKPYVVITKRQLG